MNRALFLISILLRELARILDWFVLWLPSALNDLSAFLRVTEYKQKDMALVSLQLTRALEYSLDMEVVLAFLYLNLTITHN